MSIHFLAKLFSDSEDVARSLVEHTDHVQQARTEYPRLLAQKQAALAVWDESEARALHTLRTLLHAEETVLEHSEDDEERILSDLDELHHDKGFARVAHIVRSVGYAETGHQYVHDLLQELHNCLLAQRALVKKTGLERLRELLREQFTLEAHIIEHLAELPSFERLFHEILLGEALVHRLNKGERAMKHALFTNGTFPDIARADIEASIVELEERLEDLFRELEAEEKIVNHPDVHHQTSAHPRFHALVEHVLRERLGSRATPPVIKAFWFAFRETIE